MGRPSYEPTPFERSGMSRQVAMQTSFNGGELSPRLRGRIDLAAYASGCATMLGWYPVLQGPAVAMQGMRFVGAAKGPFRAVPFEYNVTQSYLIEASDHAFRFYTNNVRIDSTPGTAFEIATPWSYAQVGELDWAQSLDVLYIVHGDAAPMVLRRLTATTFDLIAFEASNGPFDDANDDESKTVSASGDTGVVTLDASAGFFTAGDVGSLFQLEASDYSLVPAWEPGITVTAGQDRSSDGKVYTANNTARTGNVQPIHARGVEYDGMASGTDINGKAAGGVQWAYKHDNYGVMTITAVASGGASATALVLRRIPTGYTTPTWRWSFGAFSDRRGWPDAAAIGNERLVLGKRSSIYGSVVGGYTDFSARDDAGDFQRDQAFIARLPNPNVIRWLAADRKLLIGTARAEHVAEQLQVTTGTPGPPIIEVSTQSTYGSRRTRPVLADGRVLFIQGAGRKIHEMGYNAVNDRYEAPDMTRLADHIGVPGFVELAWMQEPERQLWTVRGDGTMACMTYSPSQDVFGWSRRELGGGMAAKTVATITDPAGDRDQLWVGAEIDGAWWVLRQEKLRETGDAPADALYLDAALTYSGAPIDHGTGADHLAGRTVGVLADGKPHRAITIGSGGTWAIDYPASTVHLGFEYPAQLSPMAIEAGGGSADGGGPAQGRKKKIPRLTLRLIESAGLRVSVQGLTPQAVETRVPVDPVDQAAPLFSGDYPIDTGGDFETGGTILIERFQPVPAMVAAIIAHVETQVR